jgi:hypothetical protein
LYTTLVRAKLGYASAAGNSITMTDSFKLEKVQRKFSVLSYIAYSLWVYVEKIMKVF